MTEIALMVCAVSSLAASVGGGFFLTRNQDTNGNGNGNGNSKKSSGEENISKPFFYKLTSRHETNSCGGNVLYSLESEGLDLSADINLDDVSSSVLSRGEPPSCCLEFENLKLESLTYTLFGETQTKSNIKGNTKQVLDLSETRNITGGQQTQCATDISAKFKILE